MKEEYSKIPEIYGLYFIDGGPRDECAKKVGMPGATFTNRIRTIERIIGKENADAQRALAVAINKAGLTLEDVLVGAQFAHNAKEKGINQHRAGELANQLLDVLPTTMISGTTPDEIAEVTAKVLKKAKDEGIPVSHVLNVFEVEMKKAKAIKEETAAFIKSNEHELARAAVTRAQLEDFARCKRELGEDGLNTLEQNQEFNESIKQLGYDPKRAALKLLSTDGLELYNSRLVEDNAKLASEQAEKRAKDELYDRVYRSEITVPLLDNLDHKINMIAIAQGRDKKIVLKESLIHFTEHYDPLLGLLQATTREAIKLQELQTKANWARYQFEQYQKAIPAAKTVHDNVRTLIDQALDDLHNTEEEEKKRRNNVNELAIEERKRQEKILELDNEVNKRREEIVKLDGALKEKS